MNNVKAQLDSRLKVLEGNYKNTMIALANANSASHDHRAAADDLDREMAIIKTELGLEHGQLVRIVCLDCKGTGEFWTGGRDIISDPPMNEGCSTCDCKGYHIAISWTKKAEYDIENDTRINDDELPF